MNPSSRKLELLEEAEELIEKAVEIIVEVSNSRPFDKNDIELLESMTGKLKGVFFFARRM